MSGFLRDMIAIPGESSQEKEVVQRIGEEMTAVGFDKVEVDPMGNILGRVGSGKTLIAMDAHLDTVGIGDPGLWEVDPYKGYEDEDIIVGRGTTDQRGGMASMVYAGKIIRDLGLEGDYTLLVTGTVQEEDCDGLCWQYIINEDKIRPDFVVITEPTSLKICRGQRGRMAGIDNGSFRQGDAQGAEAARVVRQSRIRDAAHAIVGHARSGRERGVGCTEDLRTTRASLSATTRYPRFDLNRRQT